MRRVSAEPRSIWRTATESIPDWFLISFGHDLLEVSPKQIEPYLKKTTRFKKLRRFGIRSSLRAARGFYRLLPDKKKARLIRRVIRSIPDDKAIDLVRQIGPNVSQSAHTYISTQVMGTLLNDPEQTKQDEVPELKFRHTKQEIADRYSWF